MATTRQRLCWERHSQRLVSRAAGEGAYVRLNRGAVRARQGGGHGDSRRVPRWRRRRLVLRARMGLPCRQMWRLRHRPVNPLGTSVQLILAPPMNRACRTHCSRRQGPFPQRPVKSLGHECVSSQRSVSLGCGLATHRAGRSLNRPARLLWTRWSDQLSHGKGSGLSHEALTLASTTHNVSGKCLLVPAPCLWIRPPGCRRVGRWPSRASLGAVPGPHSASAAT